MLQEFLNGLYEDIFDLANRDGASSLRNNAFAEVLLERLEDADMIPPARIAYADVDEPTLKGQIHAYGFDPEESELLLFYCIEANADISLGEIMEVVPIGKDEVDKGFRRLEGFVRAVKQNKTRHIDLSDPAYEAVALINECLDKDFLIHLYVLVSGTVSDKAISTEAGGNFQREVWDLVQFVRYCSGSGDDKVSVNFQEEFGLALPSLATQISENGMQIFLTCIPGEVLANIYITYRARILERNVRSFLQFAGKVNKGIRSTVLERPTYFLPFNNGLAATASSVEIEDLGSGLARIKSVEDLQIVNGGQTTATIASCLSRDKAELKDVSVAMKLTVVPPHEVENLVPLISRYANVQNKVQDADFGANEPWQIEIERQSRSLWTPPKPESPRGTRWYFDRSRNQYANELANNSSQGGRKRFLRENPKSQKITKTDLARYILSWEQEPHIVNKGGQFAFVSLMNKVRYEKRDNPDKKIFMQFIGLTILFKVGKDLYDSLGYQGYRANFVSYAVALLSYDLDQHLPFEKIWNDQKLPAYVERLLQSRLSAVNNLLLPMQTKVARFSTFLKSAECWNKVLSISNPQDLNQYYQKYTTNIEIETQKERENAIVNAVAGISPNTWFQLSSWAIAFKHLDPTERILAYNLFQILESGQLPTRDQALKARDLIKNAADIGFSHQEITDELLQELVTL